MYVCIYIFNQSIIIIRYSQWVDPGSRNQGVETVVMMLFTIAPSGPACRKVQLV